MKIELFKKLIREVVREELVLFKKELLLETKFNNTTTATTTAATAKPIPNKININEIKKILETPLEPEPEIGGLEGIVNGPLQEKEVSINQLFKLVNKNG